MILYLFHYNYVTDLLHFTILLELLLLTTSQAACLHHILLYLVSNRNVLTYKVGENGNNKSIDH